MPGFSPVVCKVPRTRPEVVLGVPRGLLDLLKEGREYNSEAGPGKIHGYSTPPPAQERPTGFVLTSPCVCVVGCVHRCVRHFAGEIKGPCLWSLVVGTLSGRIGGNDRKLR